ncbi:site-specific DNA-methyltransferase [Corynebacterium flavescens]|uniref:site-specific DNA-methyltransferase n=1 Tax=Corynebacterium flavescens TaxID=28028 RepID=UPI003FD61BFE
MKATTNAKESHPSCTTAPSEAPAFFGLVWPGKDAARAAATAPSVVEFQCLSHHPRTSGGASQDFTAAGSNRIFIGDNLDALKHLHGEGFRADIIYIDPPYNTGKDFIFRDNFRSRRHMNSKSYAQWHSEWLSLMLPRLILAHALLRRSGFLFVSIGEFECANLRKVLDEVFGEEAFAGQFIWKKAGTGKNDSKYAVVEHEYVLCYAASPDNPGFNVDFGARPTTRYNHSDERGNYSLVRLDSKTLGYLPTLDFPIRGPDGREYWPDQPGEGEKVARWRWGRDKVAHNHADLVFRRGFVYTKNYEKKGARPRSILDGERFGVTRTGRRDAEEALGLAGVFDFPKPVRLIKHLIAIGAGSDAVVLDFFAGSGTTAQAVVELNAEDGGTRSFHLVQIPQPTHPTSTAARAGLEDLAQICIARVAALPGASFDTWGQVPIAPAG